MASPLISVHGSVTIRERIAVPPGSVVTVKLVDTAGEVLAATAIEAGGVPVDFTLTADPTFTATPDELLIWAALRSEAGSWGTFDLAPVTGASTEVVLTKIEE